MNDIKITGKDRDTFKAVAEICSKNDNLRMVDIDEGVMIEQCICKDEYGVPLFKGQKYWWAREYSFSTYEAFVIYINPNCIMDAETNKYLPKETKIFASLESAERWIIENKPKDVIVYTDDEGVEFFEGEKAYFFEKGYWNICYKKMTNAPIENHKESKEDSKIYKTNKECAVEMAKYILNKYKD